MGGTAIYAELSTIQGDPHICDGRTLQGDVESEVLSSAIDLGIVGPGAAKNVYGGYVTMKAAMFVEGTRSSIAHTNAVFMLAEHLGVGNRNGDNLTFSSRQKYQINMWAIHAIINASPRAFGVYGEYRVKKLKERFIWEMQIL